MVTFLLSYFLYLIANGFVSVPIFFQEILLKAFYSEKMPHFLSFNFRLNSINIYFLAIFNNLFHVTNDIFYQSHIFNSSVTIYSCLSLSAFEYFFIKLYTLHKFDVLRNGRETPNTYILNTVFHFQHLNKQILVSCILI